MRNRLVFIVSLFLVLAAALWGAPLHAQVASPAPPLSDTQLERLHTIRAWRIEYHLTLTQDLSGSGTNSTAQSRFGVSNWNSQFTRLEMFDALFFVSGNPGCPARSCHIDYSTPGEVAGIFALHQNEQLDITNCVRQPDGTVGPGHQSGSFDDVSSAGTLLLNGTPEGAGGLNAGHSFNNPGIFSIDYSTNPPRAELFSDIDFPGGTRTETAAGCLLNQAPTTTSGVSGGNENLEFFFNDNPLFANDPFSGDTQVRVDSRGFVIRGSGDRTIVDPNFCPVSRFDNTGIQFPLPRTTSCSSLDHEHVTWEVRPAAESDLSIAGVEVTQATQTMEEPTALEARLLRDDGKPVIPIVEGKPAALRVYLHEVASETSAVVDVAVPGASLEIPLTLAPGCTVYKRRRQETVGAAHCRSVDLYFTPPAGSWTAGVTLNDGQGRVVETHTFPFKSVSTSPLTLLPVSVCDAQVGTAPQCGSVAQFSTLLPFIRATFPGTVKLVSSSATVNAFTTTGGRAWWDAMVSEIAKLWTHVGSPAGTYYFGVVRSQLPNDGIGGIGYQPGHAAAGRTSWLQPHNDMSGMVVDDAAQVVAHEVGHNLGRGHVPSPQPPCYGTPTNLDPGWPFGNTPLVQEVGFNVATGKAVLPETHADWMTYCAPRWISPYTYGALLTGATSGTGGSSAAAAAGPFWLVSGTIQGGAATIDPIFVLDATGSGSPGSGTHRIEVRDAARNVLFTRFFVPTHAHFADFEGLPHFSELVPVAPAARIVVLGPDGTELAARELVGTPPTVRVTFPAGGERLAGAQRLLWSVQDPDSSVHTFWVQYSADGGRTWRTIAPNVHASELAVDFDPLPGSENARVRVLASDGVNTGTGVSGPFGVTFKPPAAQILFPGDGTAFRKGQLVWLQAFALDPEDGFLDGAAVRWESNRDGLLGTGSQLPIANLSVGEHRITLTVTDTAANQATDVITINVGEANFREVAAAAVDTTPPTTTASFSPAANGAGWNKTNVRVILTAADNAGGSGVQVITFSASGAQTIPAMVVRGALAGIDITTEGQTTITFFAKDNAGNLEAAHSLTIRLDKTPPTIAGTRTPPPNANGWNNTNVTVGFTCADSLSGLALGSPPAPITLTGEAANQSVGGTCQDIAGNSASATVSGINIDKTPPILTVTTNPPPNGNGWNNSDVTVSFASVDALSGVDIVSGPVTLTSEGARQVVTGSATDKAGNLAVARVTLNIDKTPPEAFNQFDPARQDVVVFGRDSLSGVAPGPVAPVAVIPVNWSDEDNHAQSTDGEDNGTAELRTYQIFDLAGNFLLRVEKVKREGNEIKAKVVSLKYNNGPVLSTPRNKESFEWALQEDGTLKEFEQTLEVGIGGARQEVEAKFEAQKNQTTITREGPGPETKLIKPGLVLLRMATDRGALVLEF